MAEAGKSELAEALDAYLAATPGTAPAELVRPLATDPPAPVDGKAQLAAAYDSVLEHEAGRPTKILVSRPERWRRFVQPVVIAVGLGFIGYVWVGRPAWLFPRYDAPPVHQGGHPEQRLILADLFYRRYEVTHGRPPATLEELGAPWRDVSLVPVADGGVDILLEGPGRSLVLRRRPGAPPSVSDLK